MYHACARACYNAVPDLSQFCLPAPQGAVAGQPSRDSATAEQPRRDSAHVADIVDRLLNGHSQPRQHRRKWWQRWRRRERQQGLRGPISGAVVILIFAMAWATAPDDGALVEHMTATAQRSLGAVPGVLVWLLSVMDVVQDRGQVSSYIMSR